MHQARNTKLFLLAFIIAMAAGSLGLRLVPETVEWAPLCDIGALLAFVVLSFGLERALGVPQRDI